jgi:uroporphyrinogen decarboxylase
MTSLERVRCACRREPVDQVPVGPFTGSCAADLIGVSLRRYVTDGQVIAEAQLALQRETDQDIVVTAADGYYLAEGFGLKVRLHDNALPSAGEPLLDGLDEIDRLRVPDPHCAGRMPVYLEAVRALTAAVGDRIAIRGTGTGPFSQAAYLYGLQRFLLLLAEIEAGEADAGAERQVHRLLALTAEASTAFLRAQLQLGAHLLHLGDSLASADVISPAMYRKYAQPHHARIFAALRDECRARGAFTLLHICGDNTPVLDDFAATGVDLVEIDHKLDLALAKARIGGRVCLIGNLDPVQIVLRGTPDDVRTASARCLASAPGGGFILGTGCFVPRGTPVENLRAMVEAAEAAGSPEDRNL